MADDKKEAIPELKSALEDHPEIVRAIGMVSIEVGNLDVMMAELLAALLNKPGDVGHAIYHAPRSERVRLDIVEAVVTEMFGDGSTLNEPEKKLRRDLLSWVKRARGVVEKRHEMMHSNWGFDPSTQTVSRSKQPMRMGELIPVELKELERIVDDARKLCTEIHDGTTRVNKAIYPSKPSK